MFALVVRFEIFPDRLVEFDELVARTIPGIVRHEPGTISYVCCRVDNCETSRVFLEVYGDRASFEAHESTPHTRAFLSERTDLVESFRVEFLTPYAGKGPGLS
jgi:quinol monooxygenase YgiN